MDVNQNDLARRAMLSVTIGGHDATSHLEPYLTSFEFSDQAEGKSDEIQIELHDRDGKWIDGWMPIKGTAIGAFIRCLNWHGAGHHLALNCGAFSCDEVSCSGPPGKVTIKGVSASLAGPLRETSRSRAWERYTLQGVATEIAKRNGMELYYDADPHAFDRQDQRGESDLAFLQRLAETRGVSLKVRDNRLVLFSASSAERRPSPLAFSRTDASRPGSAVAEYEFRTASEGTGYEACTVAYHDPASGELHGATYAPETDAGTEAPSKVLKLDQRVESAADAMALAQNTLRGANKNEVTGSFTVLGHPGLVAGITVDMVGFGSFSGRYFVTRTTHSLGAKYTTRAEIRKVLAY